MRPYCCEVPLLKCFEIFPIYTSDLYILFCMSMLWRIAVCGFFCLLYLSFSIILVSVELIHSGHLWKFLCIFRHSCQSLFRSSIMIVLKFGWHSWNDNIVISKNSRSGSFLLRLARGRPPIALVLAIDGDSDRSIALSPPGEASNLFCLCWGVFLAECIRWNALFPPPMSLSY